MIEMLGVLAIIGVLSVGGIAGYSKAMMKFKTNKTIDQIAMTVTNIRTLYAQQNTYNGLTTANSIKMGVVDDAMVSGTSLINPFGGFVTISTDKSGAKGEANTNTSGTGDATYAGAFLISFGGLPREACIAIATNDWGSNYSSGMLGIQTYSAAAAKTALTCYIGGGTTTNVTQDNGKDIDGLSCATSNKPLSVASAAKGCSCTGNSANTCVVTLKYF